MRVIGYGRVSSVGQADGTSLEEQQKRIRGYCDAMGHELVGWYQDIQSAATYINRKAFKEALSALWENKADALCVLKLDRMSRSLTDALQIVADFADKQKELISISESLDTTTPAGRLCFQVLCSFSEYERLSIRERCAVGKRNKMDKGLFVGGLVPYGLMVVGERVVPHPEQIEVVKLICKLYGEGQTLRQIAHHLNKEGISRPTYHNTKVPGWYPEAIWWIVNARSKWRREILDIDFEPEKRRQKRKVLLNSDAEKEVS